VIYKYLSNLHLKYYLSHLFFIPNENDTHTIFKFHVVVYLKRIRFFVFKKSSRNEVAKYYFKTVTNQRKRWLLVVWWSDKNICKITIKKVMWQFRYSMETTTGLSLVLGMIIIYAKICYILKSYLGDIIIFEIL